MKKLVATSLIVIIVLLVATCGVSLQQINEVQIENSTLQRQSTQLETQIDGLENQTNELESQLGDLENQNSELQNRTIELETELSDFSKVSQVRITGFTITQTTNPTGEYYYHDVVVSLNNSGTSDVRGLSLVTKHTSAENSAIEVQIELVHRKWFEHVSTHVIEDLQADGTFVVTLMLDDIIVDEYHPEITESM